jgi:DNA-binding NarL/FixJ family response regulator
VAIRVLIVDHIRLTGDMFSAVLDDQPDIDVIGFCTSPQMALSQLKNCDVVLVSTNFPEDGAIPLIKSISRQGTGIKVLVVGLAESNKTIVRFIEAGSHGFIRREDSVEDLLKNIRSAYRGEALLAPDLASELISRLAELSYTFEELQPDSGHIACLTAREREVLRLIGRDFSNREIANHLIIEVGTVKNHVHNILSKLNVKSRREAASFLPSTIIRGKMQPVDWPPRTTDGYLA